MAPDGPRLRIQTRDSLKAAWTELERKSEWAQIYQTLREDSEDQEESLKLKSKDARSTRNRMKNRYRDVLPYDHSRVRLSRPEDYINASLVPVPDARRRYILTQGPLEHTAADFWAMVWEQGSPLICMLNKVMEKNQEKCFQYYPVDVGQSLDVEREFSVTLDWENVRENFTHRRFTLKKLNQASASDSGDAAATERQVEQFQFTTWPDFGVPADTSQLLEYLMEVRKSGLLDASKGATIVHCSAGIGRSGTFILVDTALNLLGAASNAETQRRDKELDITGLALEMRRYRMGLVQTKEQLEFTWRAVMDALEDDKWSELVPTVESQPSPVLNRSSGNKVTGDLHSLSIDHSLMELRSARKRSNTRGDESPAPMKHSSLGTVVGASEARKLRGVTVGGEERRKENEKLAERLALMKSRMAESDRRAAAGWTSRLWEDYGQISIIALSAAALAALFYHVSAL